MPCLGISFRVNWLIWQGNNSHFPKPKFNRHLITLYLLTGTKVNKSCSQLCCYFYPTGSIWIRRQKECDLTGKESVPEREVNLCSVTFNPLDKAFKMIWEKYYKRKKNYPKLSCQPLFILEREESGQPCFLGAPQWSSNSQSRGSQSSLHMGITWRALKRYGISSREGPGSKFFRALQVIPNWESLAVGVKVIY